MADVDMKWEKARKKRCYNQFIKLNLVKPCDQRRLNAGSNNFDITLLDCEKMKVLIMDCIAALGIVQKELVLTKRPMVTKDGEPLTKEEQDASNKVFVASLSTLANAMILDGTNEAKQSNGLERLLRAFPDYAKQTDGRSWCPLHWAILTDPAIVTEEDVKAVYTSDPMALQRYHRIDGRFYGYNPAHLLCVEEITERNLSLIRYFSVCNSQAFTITASDPDKGNSLLYCNSALHIVCGFGHPTVELLKLLLQLDKSLLKKKRGEDDYNPLGYLSKNSNFSDSLMACLLDVDSSAEVIGEAICACLESSDNSSCVLSRVKMLLMANPEAAKYRHTKGTNLLHVAARNKDMPPHVCIDIMQQILVVNKNALREMTPKGWLPVHIAARYSGVEVMEFLLDAYPESSSIFTDYSSSLLDLAVCDPESNTSTMEARVKFLCSRYPAMMLQMDMQGSTPLMSAVEYGNTSAVQMLCDAGGYEQVRVPTAHPTSDGFRFNGYLPLHCLIHHHTQKLCYSTIHKYADCFRMLLRSYPEAAGIKTGIGNEEDEEVVLNRRTPYQMAVDEDLPVYYHRLLLRAAPHLKPTRLRRLEWAEKRMAMFLAFKAVTSQKKPVLLKRLCAENKDLVKLVISFL